MVNKLVILFYVVSNKDWRNRASVSMGSMGSMEPINFEKEVLEPINFTERIIRSSIF